MSAVTGQPRPLMAGLPAAGLDRLAPAQGAFYLYADVAHLTNDSRDFCKRMLAETGVATTPGVDFDRARGAGTCASPSPARPPRWKKQCAA